jgi:hypothetical protein
MQGCGARGSRWHDTITKEKQRKTMIIELVTGLGRLSTIYTIALILTTTLLGAFVFRCVSSSLRQIAIDCIEVYSRWQSAQLDKEERRSRFAMLQDNSRQALSDHRLRLRAGYVPGQNGYVKMFVPGETDIEIEERN